MDKLDVVVEVDEAEFDVGLAGAVKLLVLLSSGQTSLPHARSVEQQPPPSEAGHERNPGEHTRMFADDEVLGGGIVLLALVDDEELVDEGATVEEGVELEGGKGAIMVVEGVDEGGGGIVDELEEDVVDGVGVTTTTAVEIAIHPTPSHAYPGKQQPPPGF